MRIPIRARWSLFRQRVILTVRWWFRLDIDTIKEQQVRSELDNLRAVDDAQLQTMQTVAGLLQQFEARLSWYEQHIPRMRDLKRQYDREQLRLKMASPDKAQALQDGILAMPQPNGSPN